MIIGWSQDQVDKDQVGILTDSEFGFNKNNTFAPNHLYNTGPVRNKSDTIPLSERNIYQWHWYDPVT